MKKSIKIRLVGNFMLVIIITVLILEVVLLNGIKQYYYKNVEDILANQIQFSTDFYSRYFSSSSLEDIIIDDIDVFWQQTTAEVQIINLDGKLLMDSLGVSYEDPIETPDVLKAKEGKKGVWIGNVEYDSVPVMSVALPLKTHGETIGIIRLISSLGETNKVINSISNLLLIMGLIVVSISGMVSLFLANSIVRPLREVTKVAEKMADGQLKVRSNKKVDDEIGKLSDTLNYMAEELIKKEQIKNDFISSISHELRTPLTSIKGWAITLKSEDLKDNQLVMDGLDIIEKESDRLTQMVEELLDFSRFVSGRIKLEKEEFDIKNTLELIRKQLKPRTKSNNIEFIVNYDENLSNIIADENRIKQVLINLLDNAFKFTPDGGRVELKVYKENESIIIKVEDNGCGISKEDLPNVKEKFYKGKNSKSHSGIGLSICDEIVKLHEGTMEIESEVNQGTIVTICLPLKEDIG
ncbi:HAMP domain-containing histidine kinase [Tissierella sp. MSJ-40]|uniref:histidine kinase n=1 Tax=Tissierella simiarum TaxID=2841534 RepID=A0ABS6E580_9FIRM|nr:HAMP domain-containing sensor histidine kinase [Tissierella simiarum]MBU5437408.1 HAMP domain-containing histidine kinase [Tissierella simiarum]